MSLIDSKQDPPKNVQKVRKPKEKTMRKTDAIVPLAGAGSGCTNSSDFDCRERERSGTTESETNVTEHYVNESQLKV
jgi:hypothetical protein